MKKSLRKLYDFKKSIYDLIFPKKCVECGKEGFWLCKKCFKKIIIIKAPFCPFCYKLTPQGQYCSRCQRYYNLTGVIIAAHYENPLKEAIHKFKYDRIKELVEPLSELLISRLELGFPRGNLVLIPIPLSKRRQLERGFNQAEILAERVGPEFEIPLLDDILFRTKERPAQIELKGKERRENIKGVFKVKGDIKKIKNKTVLLVDDVFTTGATLNEVAKTLKRAGVKNVWGLVIAKS